MTDEERLAEIEAYFLSQGGLLDPIDDAGWLIDYALHLTADRDALLVDRDAWKARCLGHTPAAKEER